jgi:catechol 2,3-dioxygenase-like lactoylglutathione lyase family enzyme
MPEASLSLLVLRTERIGACLEFYQGLGLTLVEEKHGKGPFHYSSSSNGITIEIYPETQKNFTDNSAERSIRLGFRVESLVATLESLETLGATVLKPPSITQWGNLAVILDPDGREVEINEPLKINSEIMALTYRDLLSNVYNAFNARDIDTVLAVMSADVDWPNGWEGGRVYGHEGVRDYWTRQWAAIDPHVEPVGFDTDESGRAVVKVHQVVHDLEGNVISEGMVEHVYLIEDSLIKSMEIRA